MGTTRLEHGAPWPCPGASLGHLGSAVSFTDGGGSSAQGLKYGDGVRAAGQSSLPGPLSLYTFPQVCSQDRQEGWVCTHCCVLLPALCVGAEQRPLAGNLALLSLSCVSSCVRGA